MINPFQFSIGNFRPNWAKTGTGLDFPFKGGKGKPLGRGKPGRFRNNRAVLNPGLPAGLGLWAFSRVWALPFFRVWAHLTLPEKGFGPRGILGWPPFSKAFRLPWVAQGLLGIGSPPWIFNLPVWFRAVPVGGQYGLLTRLVPGKFLETLGPREIYYFAPEIFFKLVGPGSLLL